MMPLDNMFGRKEFHLMTIGTVEISSGLALAPMAGVTDAAFR